MDTRHIFHVFHLIYRVCNFELNRDIHNEDIMDNDPNFRYEDKEHTPLQETLQPSVEYRKIQTILGDVSFSLVLPKQYAMDLGLRKGEFVKVHQEANKIIIEKI